MAGGLEQEIPTLGALKGSFQPKPFYDSVTSQVDRNNLYLAIYFVE